MALREGIMLTVFVTPELDVTLKNSIHRKDRLSETINDYLIIKKLLSFIMYTYNGASQ